MKADATAAQIARAVGSGQASARTVVEAALARIGRHGRSLGAFTDILAERALARAAAVDEAVIGGAKAGPLAGVPFAVKNLYDVEGVPTRAGSKINRHDPPARADATVVARLEAAGAMVKGAKVDALADQFVTIRGIMVRIN